ncbi:hypothetical protein HDU86_006551 [Geranomyces michiganensis]|nr:hypothetical protein HDU86_006551 [Geranomyces michiganensis]
MAPGKASAPAKHEAKEAKEKENRKEENHDGELQVKVWHAQFDTPGAYFLKISIEPPKGGQEASIRRTEVVSGVATAPNFQNNSFAIPFPLPKKKRSFKWLSGEEHRELVIAAGVVETNPPAVQVAGESSIPLASIMERLLKGDPLKTTLPIHAPVEHGSSRAAVANRGTVGTLEIELRLVTPEKLHPTLDDQASAVHSYTGSYDSIADSRIPRDIDKEIARVLREPDELHSANHRRDDAEHRRHDEGSEDIVGALPPSLHGRNLQYRPPPPPADRDAASARYQPSAPDSNGDMFQFRSFAPPRDDQQKENIANRWPSDGVAGKAKQRAASPNFARSISNARAHRGADLQGRQQGDAYPDTDSRNPLTARLIKELDERNAGIQKMGRELVRLRDVNAQLEGEVRRLQAQLSESELRTSSYMRAVDLEVLSESELRRRYAILLQKLQTETDAKKSLEVELAASQQVRMERNELERQLLEIRAAHTAQQMYLQKLQEKVQSAAKYQAVIAKQERVIAGLEELLHTSANAERERANQLEYELLRNAQQTTTQPAYRPPVAIPHAPAFTPENWRTGVERRGGGGEDVAFALRAERAEQRAAALENEACIPES